jgi:hypothetical protein
VEYNLWVGWVYTSCFKGPLDEGRFENLDLGPLEEREEVSFGYIEYLLAVLKVLS